MAENDPKFLKTDFPHKWKNLTKKLACPYEYFNSNDDYQKRKHLLRMNRRHFLKT